ncbi:hypothetical protein SAMN05428974_0011 [Sphingopyxis sp. YR583]|jgi:hypothetical protein|uniref:hypothetical protein n=1 Tax=Sphingopyxis sp. YR583 TaxID=1881047 RepID=UPI0008A79C8A|nr:hypothetical protein [Sphingopyxis sp. YR583]SEH10624.1 hypothetical protein SAMN05428974_0011 [Sphingopyxis sp. YR583]
MTRAINLGLAESELIAICRAARIGISAIEPLKSGGTRLVCMTRDGAEEIRRRLAANIIDGEVDRYRFYRPPQQ